MHLLGNLIWLVFGGFMMGLGWCLAGVLAALSIVGLPWAKACFVMAQMAFLPFGKVAVSRQALSGHEDIGTGPFGFIGNVIWFVFGGWWLALCHLGWGLLCCISIVGIPFGLQHFKLAGIALAPIGKTVVDADVAVRA